MLIEYWRTSFAAVVLALLLIAGMPSAHADDAAAPALPAGIDQSEIEAIIRAYLLEHPEVVVEALKAFDEKRAAAEEARAREMISALSDQLYDNPLSPVGGNPNGDVTIVEFFDYNCPYCKRVTPDLKSLVDSDGEIRLVYKEWPILSPESEIAARAALAAYQQDSGAYQKLHDAMMAQRGKLDRDIVLALAASAGLNIERLETDMTSSQVEAELEHVRRLAEQIGINGTPAFLIGRTLVPGAISFEQMQKLVDAARES
jgi:protein-disulfide isomerase